MTIFSYRALTPDGTEITGVAEAADATALAALLGAGGRILVEARAGGGRAARLRQWLTPSVDPRRVTTMLSELAMLLKGGQPVDEALSLIESGLGGGLARVVRALREAILAGAGPAEAFAAHPAVFPPEVVALVRVAEATGRLDRAMEAAVLQRERTQALAEKLGAALRYPLFLLITALGVLVFFLLFVIPQFSGIIKEAGGRPGAFIAAAIWLSEALAAHLDAVQAGGVVLAASLLIILRRPALRRPVVAMLARLPVVSGLLGLRSCALFCVTLGTLLGQGVPITEALRVIASMLDPAAATALARISDAVRRGLPLADALDEEGFLPPIARRMLRIGEESGELAGTAAQAGRLFETKLEHRLDQVAALVGPIAIIAIAGLIGGLMVTIMMALIDVNQMIF